MSNRMQSILHSKVNACEIKSANLRCLKWNHNSLKVTFTCDKWGTVHNTKARSVLHYRWETLSPRIHDAWGLFVLNQVRLQSIASFWLEHRVSYGEVDHPVEGGNSHHGAEVFIAHRIWGIGHLLRIYSHGLRFLELIKGDWAVEVSLHVLSMLNGQGVWIPIIRPSCLPTLEAINVHRR